MMGTCPDCEENFEIGDGAEIGDFIDCPGCKARLEILDLQPVVLDFAVDNDDVESLEPLG
jgi:lysine biosynthesis protein LysW